ncbi:TetR/AcrR family transcriptional regulator [Candidatus Bathyarchaeota archaeon]|nr:TetR/AcrR family transcriptional regulator [Candidatus Bathyarchaeota archaeon]
MTRKVKDPEQRREEFLTTAQELFREKGYYATSVDDIVDRMGVAKGLFYYYFRTKEELVEGIVDSLWEGAVEEYERIRDRDDLSALQKLLLYGSVRGSVKVQQTYLLDLYVQDRDSPLVQRLTERGVEVLVPILGDIISQGVEEGTFDTGYPLEAAEFLIRGAAALLRIDTGDPEQVMRGFAISLDLWERVLGAERGSFMVFMEENRGLMEEFARQAGHFKRDAKDGDGEGVG